MSDTVYNHLYTIALCLVQGVGVHLGKRLIETYGSAQEVFCVSRNELLAFPKLSRIAVDQIASGSCIKKAEEEIRFAEQLQAEFLFYQDCTYPTRLKECVDAPILLVKQGDADLNAKRVISVVGSRKASPYGVAFVEQLCADLAPFGVIVVSGLALGIDCSAHKYALQEKLPTVGVLGHGLDIIYPASHYALAKQIVDSGGGLLTEFFINSPKDRSNFIRRNRIIAGLCDAVIVVESDLKGGALNTARYGNDYNRDVYALPGNVGRLQSRGCNNLIKTNRAGLIESFRELEHSLQLSEQSSSAPQQTRLFVDYNDDEKAVVDALLQKPNMHIDELSRVARFPVNKLSSVLFSLEMKNVLLVLPGKRYAMI